jgi:hypothetical protein
MRTSFRDRARPIPVPARGEKPSITDENNPLKSALKN